MKTRRSLVGAALLATFCSLLYASSLEPIHSHCTISAGEHAGRFRLQLDSEDCVGHGNCHSNFSNDSLSRFTGITLADLANDGAHLTATIGAEAGTLTCAGTVHNGSLIGDSTFTPSAEFVSRMEQMGFSGFDAEKLEAYALLDVESEWARSMQQAGIRGMTTDNLIALRIFNIDPEYARSFVSLGYEMPDAEKLIALKVQGVDPKEVREIRALGYQPTLDELIQIRIFRITPDFIHRIQSRGFKDLTIAKLVQIRIFNLAE